MLVYSGMQTYLSLHYEKFPDVVNCLQLFLKKLVLYKQKKKDFINKKCIFIRNK
jgi:hypothetical protein